MREFSTAGGDLLDVAQVADDRDVEMWRRAQAARSGTIWLSRAALALNRVAPLSPVELK